MANWYENPEIHEEDFEALEEYLAIVEASEVMG